MSPSKDNRTQKGAQEYGEQTLVTPPGRASYPKLAEPDDQGQYADGKFKTNIIFPEDADLTVLKKECAKLARKKWGKGVDLKALVMPFKDCAEKEDSEGYDEGGVYLTCKSKRRPGVLNRKGENIDPADVYGGCWVKLALRAGTYEATETVVEDGKRKRVKTRGVSFFLEHVLFWKDDEEFGGSRGSAQEAFADDIDGEGDDPDDYPDDDDGEEEDAPPPKEKKKSRGQGPDDDEEEEDDLPF